MESRFYFNLQFFKRFYGLLRLMFPRACCGTSLLFVFLLCLLILEEVIVYQVGMIPSKYYKVLGNRDDPGFRTLTLTSLLTVASIAFVKAAGKYASSLLYVTWREYVIAVLHRLYFKDINYYNLNVLDQKLDNPDQRITQDLDKMCSEFSEVIAKVIISPFKIVYYSYKSWVTAGYLGPVCVYVFFLVSTVINKLLMSPVVNLVYQQEKREGNLRFKHMQVRVNAEGVAFYGAGGLERDHTDAVYSKLLSTQQSLVRWQFPLNFAVQSAAYLGSILSYIIVGIPILVGDYSDLSPVDISSLISKNSFFIMYLINCFTQLIELAIKIGDVAGTTHRVSQLVEKLRGTSCRDLWKHNQQNEGICSPVLISSNTTIANKALDVTHLTYGPPNSQDILAKDVGLQLIPGCNILVTGDSGCGKSSLLRVIAGLWPQSSGSINWDIQRSDVLFLPQKPYFTDGSLKQQICFPRKGLSCDGVSEDKKIEENLKIARLQNLLERTGGLHTHVDWNWYDMLSPGEMQRLSFVRLFYHKPLYAILDEASSQLDIEMERIMYERCSELGITLLSVGHRQTLEQYHHMKLQLSSDASWSLTMLSYDTCL